MEKRILMPLRAGGTTTLWSHSLSTAPDVHLRNRAVWPLAELCVRNRRKERPSLPPFTLCGHFDASTPIIFREQPSSDAKRVEVPLAAGARPNGELAGRMRVKALVSGYAGLTPLSMACDFFPIDPAARNVVRSGWKFQTGIDCCEVHLLLGAGACADKGGVQAFSMAINNASWSGITPDAKQECIGTVGVPKAALVADVCVQVKGDGCVRATLRGGAERYRREEF